MDTVGWFWDVMNLIFLAIIPLIIKFLNDLNRIYVELKSDIEKHKVEIENLRDELKELRGCLGELKKILITQKNQ